MSHNSRLLANLTVIDLTQQLPGPFATGLLVSLGARVIKVEPPQGDPSRVLDPAMFARVNMGKETMRLDLKTKDGRASFHELLASSDVVVESFRPGVAERLDVDWSTCRLINPRLIYCSLTGFGRYGAYSQVPVHDLNLMAWGDPEGARRLSGRIGVPWVDLGTWSTASLMIVAAWHDALVTGVGRHIDVSMQDIALSWSRVKPLRSGLEPSYTILPTRDGHEVVVAILEDHFWLRLCDALGLHDLRSDSDLTSYEGRRDRASEILGRIRDRVVNLSLPELLALAKDHDVPITTVHPEDDPLAMEHLEGTEFKQGGFQWPTVSGITQSPAKLTSTGDGG